MSRAVGKPVVRNGPDGEKDWKEEYDRLREEYTALRQLCNEQEDHIRRYILCVIFNLCAI